MATVFDADVIIIGAGMLGGLAAEALALQGKSVLILEAGPRVPRWKLVEYFRNSPDKNDFNAFYPDLPWAPKALGGRYSDHYLENVGPLVNRPGMLRLVGGTTWHWSSAFWRSVPNDFKLRTLYGHGRDWPIGYEDLERYYTRVEQATGCSGNNVDDQSGQGGKPWPPRSAPYPLPVEAWSSFTQIIAAKLNGAGFHFIDQPHLRATVPFDGRPTCCGNNNCAPLCPIGAQYTGDIAIARAERAGAHLLTETVAYRLEKGPGSRIVAVHSKSPDGRSTRRTARSFILAAHAIEIPKLMLMSEVGNSSDQVGRNLMGHNSLAFEVLIRDAVWPGRGPVQQGAIMDWRDGPHRSRHAALKYSCNQRVPNLDVTDRLLKQGIIGRELDERIRQDAARFVSINAQVEMLASPTNRVTLSARTDALGLPTPRIHYDVDDYMRKASVVVQKDYERFDQVLGTETSLSNRQAWRQSAHIMGTTVMGSDPRDSVVNGDCRTHDHENLFIASTGVFPSATAVNPTLTGAALTLRMAELIGREV